MIESREKLMRVVIVGGGIAGILAARAAGRAGHDTTIIEREDDIGGLFRSVRDQNGRCYDRGSHFVIGVDDPAVNAEVVDGLAGREWITIKDSLAEGALSFGKNNPDSGVLDARFLDQQSLLQARSEIMQTTAYPGATNLEEELLGLFGPTLVQRCFSPLMTKYTGQPLHALAPGLHKVYSLARVILFDRETSIRLKKDPRMDAVLAFTHRNDSPVHALKWYPQQGGIDGWVRGLARNFRDQDVTVRTQQTVVRIESCGDTITGVVLADGTLLGCDLLVWTVSPALLARAAGVALGPPPPTRDLLVAHLAYDRPLLTDLHFLTYQDPAFAGFRVMMYDNVTRDEQGMEQPHLTVEAFVGANDQPEEWVERMTAELLVAGIVDPEAKCITRFHQRFANVFPLPSASQTGRLQEALDQLNQRFCNLALFGRQATGDHFQNNVLKQAIEGIGKSSIGRTNRRRSEQRTGPLPRQT
jgi:protoporphyrinogen oxidase